MAPEGRKGAAVGQIKQDELRSFPELQSSFLVATSDQGNPGEQSRDLIPRQKAPLVNASMIQKLFSEVTSPPWESHPPSQV
jgi:hypothetical protein